MAQGDGGGGAGIYKGGEDATDILGEDSFNASIDRGGLGGDETHPGGYDGIYRGANNQTTPRSQAGGGGANAGRGGKGVIGALRTYRLTGIRGLRAIGVGAPGAGGDGAEGGFAVKINNVQVVWVGGFIPDQVKGIVG